MNAVSLENKFFSIGIDPRTGALENLSLKNDPEKMNWILSPEENPWHSLTLNWGLGYLNLAVRHGADAGLVRWESPASLEIRDDSMRAVYERRLFRVTVERCFSKEGFLVENYRVENKAADVLGVNNLAVHTPFNDNYPDSSRCIRGRCDAHLWCGASLTWIHALRMGGKPPHLGLLATSGSFSAYEISERRLIGNSSNVRGAISLLADVKEIPAGGNFSFSWMLFPNESRADFRKHLLRYAPCPVVEPENCTVTGEEEFKVNIYKTEKISQSAFDSLKASVQGENARSLEIERKNTSPDAATVSLKPDSERYMRLAVSSPENPALMTYTKLQRVDDPLKLIRKRARFIMEHQQCDDPASENFGAFLVYDNECDCRILGKGDLNSGRERVGMGVLLAMVRRMDGDSSYDGSLKRYHDFIRNRLQTPDAHVLDSPGGTSKRLYNYPWVVRFHLAMFDAFREERYLRDAIDTMNAFYQKGHSFYAIDIPLRRLLSAMKDSPFDAEREAMLSHFEKHCEYIAATGLNVPPHEVNFEQSIVAPAAQLLLDYTLETGSGRYLSRIGELVECLDCFNGRQPDFHLRNIAIRHWDGWWFGKRKFWGDTFPHYWSTLSANVFHRLWLLRGNAGDLSRTREILLNNLCLFTDDGRGSCAYVYPQLVGGEVGCFFDPYANDQDWALVYYLDACSDFSVVIQ